MDFLGKITENTKDIICEKCGGVLVDSEGRANISQNSNVIPVVTIDELEKQRQRELKKKREELDLLEKEILILEKEDY
jgi:hypothetical protein